jgi:diguanylate cyclase (GGDEF)-like protein
LDVLPGIDSIHYQEFTEVFSLLKNMQATIREQFDQLYEANAHLEEKVAQRTDALERNILLLDKQQQSLSGLVKYAIAIQQQDGLENIGPQTRQLAEDICEQGVGVYLARGEGFSGYLNHAGLPPDARQLLIDKADQLRDYEGLVKLADTTELLQIFAIGNSANSYQGFLATTKSQLSGRVHETLMVLCSILGSSLKQHNLTNRLDRLAHMDSVTRLPNRHYFNSVFSDKQSHFDAGQERSHFAIFVIDVNGLKPMNDNYGHEYGDQMLRQVAAALGKAVRPRDTVARVGGDEFYMILESAGQQTCEQFAQRLRELQKDLFMEVEDKRIAITFSYGFASTDVDSLKNLIALADERMYFAKKEYYQNLQNAQEHK